jgi:hypothetical protein
MIFDTVVQKYDTPGVPVAFPRFSKRELAELVWKERDAEMEQLQQRLETLLAGIKAEVIRCETATECNEEVVSGGWAPMTSETQAVVRGIGKRMRRWLVLAGAERSSD